MTDRQEQQQQEKELIYSSEPPVLNQPEQATIRKKKKTRGNRKLQRFRAKLRKQGFSAEHIQTLIEQYHQPISPPHVQEEDPLMRMNISVDDFIDQVRCSFTCPGVLVVFVQNRNLNKNNQRQQLFRSNQVNVNEKQRQQLV